MAFDWHESQDIEPVPLPTITVYCCREWDVIAFCGWGYCGDCGRVPQRRNNE